MANTIYTAVPGIVNDVLPLGKVQPNPAVEGGHSLLSIGQTGTQCNNALPNMDTGYIILPAQGASGLYLASIVNSLILSTSYIALSVVNMPASGGAADGTAGLYLVANRAGNRVAPGTAPSAALTAGTATAGGAVDAGSHVWAFTYVTAGVESSLSASTAAKTVVGGTQTVPLTAITVGPGGTTARYVYRSKANTTTPLYLLTIIGDNTTTTFSDTLADSALKHPAGSGALFEQPIAYFCSAAMGQDWTLHYEIR